MKQVFRRVIDRKGTIVVEEVPVPHVGQHDVLVDTRASSISTGTETATLNKTLPELVKQTLSDPWMRQAVKNIIASGGVLGTADRVHDELILNRLVGYSGSGVVLDTGTNVSHVKKGDRVAYCGWGHSEVAKVSRNQCVLVPDGLEFDEAAFATIGAIALQGVRRAEVEIGATVAVLGLGLVGQLVSQLLRAAGADCIGIEPNPARRELAQGLAQCTTIDPASESAVERVLSLTGGQGADRVLICASGKNKQIANDALKMCRQQGRVTVVGIVPMELERMPFFLKELDFVFSRAYGPGPFDADWESGRSTYAPHYIRWDASRNMQAFLRQVAAGRVQVKPLISKTYDIDEAQSAYGDLTADGQMASVLTYTAASEETVSRRRVNLSRKAKLNTVEGVRFGVIGCGNYTRSVLLPTLRGTRGAEIQAIAAATGTNAQPMAKKYGVGYITTDHQEMLDDEQINAIIISTRHHLHAELTKSALRAGKHVMVEKPLAMNVENCLEIAELAASTGLHCIVGHNRRYAPLTQRLLAARPEAGPAFMTYTVNIRQVPKDHWTLNATEGGGRLLGECDHFFDMLNLFARSDPSVVFASAWLPDEQDLHECCNMSVQVQYENGSVGVLQYSDQGYAKFPRESLQVLCGGSVMRLADYRTGEVLGKRSFRAKSRADMGHSAELQNFVDHITGKRKPLAEISDGVQATLVAQAALQSLQSGERISFTDLLTPTQVSSVLQS